jgi:hypothetical protein
MLLAVSFGGRYVWDDDFSVEWVITEGTSTVQFTVKIAEELHKNAEWWGIGWSETESDKMLNSDIYFINKNAAIGDRLTDNYATVNQKPTQDASTCLTLISHGLDTAGAYVTIFTRELTSTDSNDISFTVNNDYNLLMAYGVGNHPNQVLHTAAKSTEVTFENDYDGDDDFTGFLTYAMGLCFALGMIFAR